MNTDSTGYCSVESQDNPMNYIDIRMCGGAKKSTKKLGASAFFGYLYNPNWELLFEDSLNDQLHDQWHAYVVLVASGFVFFIDPEPISKSISIVIFLYTWGSLSMALDSEDTSWAEFQFINKNTGELSPKFYVVTYRLDGKTQYYAITTVRPFGLIPD